MAEQRAWLYEEALAFLKVKANEIGNNFRLKIMRRKGVHALPENVATFDEATVEQIAQAEQWLPVMFGGGPNYFLTVYASGDIVTPLGPPFQLNFLGDPKETIDFDLLNQDWKGPRKLVWPKKKTDVPTYSYTPSIGVAGGAHGPPAVPTPPPQSTVFTAESARLEVERSRLENDRNQLLEMRQRLEAERHKMELDAIRRENDLRIAEIERRVSAPTNAPGKSGVADIAAAFAPIVAQFLQAQDAMRLEMFKAQQAQAAEQQKLLTTVLERKTEESPNSKIFSNIAESMGAMMKMGTDFMRTQAELVNGPPESNALLAVKEVTKAVQAIAAGAAAKAAMGTVPPMPAAPQLVRAPQMVANLVAPSSPALNGHTPSMARPEPIEAGGGGALTKIKQMIVAQADPASVASVFIAQSGDPELRAALQAVGNNPVTLFEQHLDDWWKEDPVSRGAYMGVVAQQLQSQYAAFAAVHAQSGGELVDNTSDDSSDDVEEEETHDDA